MDTEAHLDALIRHMLTETRSIAVVASPALAASAALTRARAAASTQPAAAPASRPASSTSAAVAMSTGALCDGGPTDPGRRAGRNGRRTGRVGERSNGCAMGARHRAPVLGHASCSSSLRFTSRPQRNPPSEPSLRTTR